MALAKQEVNQQELRRCPLVTGLPVPQPPFSRCVHKSRTEAQLWLQVSFQTVSTEHTETGSGGRDCLSPGVVQQALHLRQFFEHPGTVLRVAGRGDCARSARRCDAGEAVPGHVVTACAVIGQFQVLVPGVVIPAELANRAVLHEEDLAVVVHVAG